MAELDPYAVLGVAPCASDARIQEAYRALAKRHHPDLNPGDAAAEQRFKEVAAAHALLSPASARARFDAAAAERARGAGRFLDEAQGPSPALTLLTLLTLLFLLAVIIYDKLRHPDPPEGGHGALYLILVLVPFFALMYGICRSVMAWAALRGARNE
jgi:curved DNA-binding protein CbpA